jgi:hypothetical protein
MNGAKCARASRPGGDRPDLTAAGILLPDTHHPVLVGDDRPQQRRVHHREQGGDDAQPEAEGEEGWWR